MQVTKNLIFRNKIIQNKNIMRTVFVESTTITKTSNFKGITSISSIVLCNENQKNIVQIPGLHSNTTIMSLVIVNAVLKTSQGAIKNTLGEIKYLP